MTFQPALPQDSGEKTVDNSFSSASADRNAIKKQWELFQQGREVDFSVISRGLYASWVRSRHYQVDPYRKKREFVPPQELQAILESNRDFINSASSIMSKLFKSIDMLNGTITLADKNGVVLYSCHQERHNITPSHVVGDILSERVCGTNGIGTCLAEGSSVELAGAEHYSLEEHAWHCSAAPVYDNRANVIGVFNISIPFESSRYYQTGGLVEAVAHAITEQIFLSTLLSEQMAIMDLLDEGVVVLNADGVIKSINKKACAILKLTSPPEGQNFRRVIHTHDNIFAEFSQNTSFHHREVTFFNGIRSIPCLLSFSPIPNRGSVLTLQEHSRIRELASRAIGAKAIYTFDRILGDSKAIQHAVHMGKNAARSDITTLILGDSGTGKELFAQSIHNASSRRQGPFVVVNCGAIPRNLVQAELFGYNEGAFTGATRQGKPGKFELADGGTIFLDEIGEMPLEAQVSLLRLLQNGEVTRVGGKKSTYVNVRVIAATNRNLQEAVAQSVFRKALYYRLNAFVLHIPALAEREDDVCLLADAFLSKFSAELGKNLTGFDNEVISVLKLYRWPGNVRELENCIERAVAMAEGSHITMSDIPASISSLSQARSQTRGKLQDRERETIYSTLEENRWNIRRTAAVLGVARSTLYLKMKKFNIVQAPIHSRPTPSAGSAADEEGASTVSLPEG